MAEGILGLGSDGSVDLSSELIEKLKTAEAASTVDPIAADIVDVEAEIVAFDEIQALTTELLDIIETFDLYTTDTNVFESVSASTNGDSVTFDATDTSNLEPGTINVTINQLAQKDVYQSELITDIEATLPDGTLTLTVGPVGDTEEFTFETDGLTYEELVEQMNYNAALDVTLEQVSDDGYRLVLKSSGSGEENELLVTADAADSDSSAIFGFNNTGNHVLESQNLEAEVDGISYELSNNQISLQSGLTITVVEQGDSSITIERDTSSILEAIESIATKYNELVDLVNANIYGSDDGETSATLTDTSTMRMVMASVKDILFDDYGLEEDQSLFAYGFSFDVDGYLQIDSDDLNDAITNNFDDLQSLFVGYAEKEGLATQLKTYLDDLDGFDGIYTTFEEGLDERLTTLGEDEENAQETLDAKYQAMSTQFAAYTVIITAMQNSFSALEAIIDADDS